MASNKERLPDLVPLRLARMSASPFAFFRGAAAVMASDLASAPVTGIHVVIDGDAHLNNFGLYGTPQRDIVFDLNDFDETVIGPWEWDLKRLTASVTLAARANRFSRSACDTAVRACTAAYIANMSHLEAMGVLDTWYQHTFPTSRDSLTGTNVVLHRAAQKASQQTNTTFLEKNCERLRSGWRFRSAPPILTRVDRKTRQQVIDALHNYVPTLLRERQFMIAKYRIVDVARRVVGVGSVGARAYLVLLTGNGDDDALFLQVKQAFVPAHAPFVSQRLADQPHQGKRVITGQRVLQASSDMMLGWTNIGSLDFYVRQMRNLKGSVDYTTLSPVPFNQYVAACGALLARAHARVGDAAAIAGYCGRSAMLGEALTRWAESYADQTERDHAALVAAVKHDRKVQAMIGK